jgi:hypothetical protein
VRVMIGGGGRIRRMRWGVMSVLAAFVAIMVREG